MYEQCGMECLCPKFIFCLFQVIRKACIAWIFMQSISTSIVLASPYPAQFTSIINITEKHQTAFRHASVLVFGAAGFIGSQLVQKLHSYQPRNLVCLDRFDLDSYPVIKRFRADKLSLHHNVDVIEHKDSLCDVDSLWEAIKGKHYSHVLVLEVGGLERHTGDEHFLSSNVHHIDCVERMLSMLTYKGKYKHPDGLIPRFVYTLPDISRVASRTVVKEIYNRYLRLGERYFASSGKSAVGIQFPSVYGPWDQPTSLPYLFSERIVRRKEIVLRDGGLRVHGFSHVEDVVSAIKQAMSLPFNSSGVISVQPETFINELTLLRKIELRLNKTALIIMRPIEQDGSKSEDPTTSHASRISNVSSTSPSQSSRSFAEEWIHSKHISPYSAGSLYGLHGSLPIPILSSDSTIQKFFDAAAADEGKASTDAAAARFYVTGLSYDDLVPSRAQLKTVAPRVGLDLGLRDFISWYRKHESSLFPCASECTVAGLCFRSVWDQIAALSRSLTAGCLNAFYTVAIDDSMDGLHPVNIYQEDYSLKCNIAFVNRNSPLVRNETLALNTGKMNTEVGSRTSSTSSSIVKGTIGRSRQVTKDTHIKYGNWTIIIVDDLEGFRDPRKPTRVPKLSPSKFFHKSVQFAVYLDSKLRLTCDPRDFIARMYPTHPDNKNRSIALLAVRISDQHPGGILRHMMHVYNRTFDRPSITFYNTTLLAQHDTYGEYEKRFKVKFDNLYDGAFLVHRVRSSAARDFRCLWYTEYQSWSDRDQAAGAYALTQRAAFMGSSAARHPRDFIPIGVDSLPTESKYDPDHYSSPMGMGYSKEVGFGEQLPWLTLHKGRPRFGDRFRPRGSVGMVDSGDGGPELTQYVHLLPRLQYHWEFTKRDVIGRLELFNWNRGDDAVYYNASISQIRKDERHALKNLRFRNRIFFSCFLFICITGLSVTIGFIIWDVRCRKIKRKNDDLKV